MKRLIIAAIVSGTILGTSIALYLSRETPAPAFDVIMTDGTVQRKAFDAFVRGYIARESQQPETLVACQGLSRASSIFCLEGYWHAKFLSQLRAGDPDKALQSLDQTNYEWTEGPAVARGTALTAFGMAIAEVGKTPAAFKSTVTKPGFFGHLVDGWIFMLARSIGLPSAAEKCRTEGEETRSACEFGVGRAAWFEKSGDEWIKSQTPGILAGFEFARRFTSQNTAEELQVIQTAGFGDKVGIIDKLLWFGNPAKDAESKALYDCQAGGHPARCRKN